MGFIVGAGLGLHQLFMASVKRQICLGLHFLLSVSLTTYPFQMRSAWAGQSGLSHCRVEDVNHSHTKAEARRQFVPVHQSLFNHANATIRNLSIFAPWGKKGTTFLPQGATLTDIINTEMDQVSLMWHLLQRLCRCSTSEATLTRANSSKLCLIWSFGAAERRDETRNIKCGAQS